MSEPNPQSDAPEAADTRRSPNGAHAAPPIANPPFAPLEAVPAPSPIDLPPAGKRRALGRSLHMGALGARYFAPVVARTLVRRPAGSARAGRRMFEHLGSTYVKFGQFIASAPGIVGEDVAEEFRSCLDTGPVVPFPRVRAAVENAVGMPLEDAFSAFDERPIAAASIAVVHRARLRDGADVAVKVLRPGIEQAVATDLAMLDGMLRFAGRRGVDQAYNGVSLLAGLRAQIAEELDLRNEARAMAAFRALFARFDLRLLAIPKVYEDFSSRRVLTMEYFDGVPIDDLAGVARYGVEPAPLVRELLHAWVLTGARVAAFHADIHAGNLLILRDGRLGMLDWGIVSRMEDESHRMFRAICEATLGREAAWEEMGQVMLRINGPSFQALGLSDEQVVRFCRGMFEPVLTRPMRDVDMSGLMMTGDDVIRIATGEEPPRRGIRDRWRAMRLAGRAFRQAERDGTFEHPTFRSGFLSMKQLVYLERYGRMYIPEESIMGDGEFVRRALNG